MCHSLYTQRKIDIFLIKKKIPPSLPDAFFNPEEETDSALSPLSEDIVTRIISTPSYLFGTSNPLRISVLNPFALCQFKGVSIDFMLVIQNQ